MDPLSAEESQNKTLTVLCALVLGWHKEKWLEVQKYWALSQSREKVSSSFLPFAPTRRSQQRYLKMTLGHGLIYRHFARVSQYVPEVWPLLPTWRQRVISGVSDLSLQIAGRGTYNPRQRRSRATHLIPGAHVWVLLQHVVPSPKYFTSNIPVSFHLWISDADATFSLTGLHERY